MKTIWWTGTKDDDEIQNALQLIFLHFLKSSNDGISLWFFTARYSLYRVCFRCTINPGFECSKKCHASIPYISIINLLHTLKAIAITIIINIINTIRSMLLGDLNIAEISRYLPFSSTFRNRMILKCELLAWTIFVYTILYYTILPGADLWKAFFAYTLTRKLNWTIRIKIDSLCACECACLRSEYWMETLAYSRKLALHCYANSSYGLVWNTLHKRQHTLDGQVKDFCRICNYYPAQCTHTHGLLPKFRVRNAAGCPGGSCVCGRAAIR